MRAEFERSGYTIQSNVAVALPGGHRIELDGLDTQHNVGFEYMTNERGDFTEFSPEVRAALEHELQAGRLYVFLVDAHEVATEEFLVMAVRMFLKQVSARRNPSEPR